ncbi:hypothetical protein PENANT_c002G05146 [Penicillium antarcticum]|uniref:Uncharacterized protein n=1 Tax=Penicillium antarcticum TaxID=416450 RepID=A0A1V6QL95_9EURO|nr:hypothetical protein PENANT_c002G05146 [Penicillium antarcticum]
MFSASKDGSKTDILIQSAMIQGALVCYESLAPQGIRKLPQGDGNIRHSSDNTFTT